MAGIVFEKASKEELSKVASLFNVFLSELRDISKDPYFDFTDLSKEDRERRLLLNNQKNQGCVYLAKDGEEIVGLLSGMVIECFLAVSSIDKIGYIEGAYVADAYRGRGIMAKLEAYMIDYFKSLGLIYCELCIISKNQMARSCWEKLGYETFREQMRKKIG